MTKTEYRIKPSIDKNNNVLLNLEYKTVTFTLNTNTGTHEVYGWVPVPSSVYGLFVKNQEQLQVSPSNKYELQEFVAQYPDIQVYLDKLQAEYDELVSLD